ncbi:MBL fold metallo-hydrolase [Paenibacillus sp. MER TA 81-3]|uniref:MBL fold metallo-hydrolase n=1 Tax=Paenibacillus sp. MER TA 81-3 TaxID=2939573 RepID=UPI00203BE749|nr:MBL fold metallo-hydrolase [Paenibacillus sp. MER TA 81-3]MCM3337125.1 MBL fold metallo-hydrolase [Paenibacillus sp. MER TA 81-3]
MKLKIQMIGTGSAFAKHYFNNNALLYTEQSTLLIDCGITAPMALHKLGKSFVDIDGVLITHIHADHVGGLEEFAFQMKFIHGRKPKLYIASPLVQPLWNNTLKGGLTQEGISCLEDVFEVHALEPNHTYSLAAGMEIQLIETPHIAGKRSFSLLVNHSFFYSADMRFQPDLLHTLIEQQGVTLIFHDCQLTGKGEVHTTLAELLTLPEWIQRKIYLMHYGDERSQYEGHTGPMPFVEQHKIITIREQL